MRIWMHTIGYPPEKVGGTEIHVRDLAECIVSKGHSVDVSYLTDRAGNTIETKEINGVRIHRAAKDSLEKLVKVIDEAKPDVFHNHPLYPDSAMKILRVLPESLPVITTYHTPTVSCMRGSLLLHGEEPCDGRLIQTRCSECVLEQKGMPRVLAGMFGKLPASQIKFCPLKDKIGFMRRAHSMLNWPYRVSVEINSFKKMCGRSNNIIAVCGWLAQLISRNNIPQEKINIIRYGRNINTQMQHPERDDIARFGYLGRLTKEKGIDTLLKSIQLMDKNAKFTMEFLSPAFENRSTSPGSAEWADEIIRISKNDPRVVVLGCVMPEEVSTQLAQWDALIVPSTWLETGPQVITEAYMVKTPSIGSRRGGIAELIDDGKTGFLFTPGNEKELAELLESCARDTKILRDMRNKIPPPRTVEDMADDVLKLYKKTTS